MRKNLTGTVEKNKNIIDVLVPSPGKNAKNERNVLVDKITFQTSKKPPNLVSGKLQRETGIVMCAQLPSTGRYIYLRAERLQVNRSNKSVTKICEKCPNPTSGKKQRKTERVGCS